MRIGSALRRGVATAVLVGAAALTAGCTAAEPDVAASCRPAGSAPIVRDGQQYRLESAGRPWSLERCGSIDRFEVRPSDVWPGDEGRTGVGRSELAGTAEWPAGRDVWVSYWLKVASTDPEPRSWLVLGQFYPRPDPGEGFYSPGFGVLLMAHDLQIQSRADPDPHTAGNPPQSVRYEDKDFALGVWHRFVFRLRFAPSGGGQLTIWVDGVQRFGQQIALGYQDVHGPYWKYGLYGGNSTRTRVVEYARMEVSASSLEDRVAHPLPR